MAIRIIDKEWRAFASRIYQGASPLQVQECRRAFYAGAVSMFHAMVESVSSGESDQPTAADLQLMEDIDTEIETYVQDLQHGRA
jgi:hypothetical protein